MKLIIVVTICIVWMNNSVNADEDVANKEFEKSIYKEAYQFIDECGSKDVKTCLKERALRYIEKLPSNIEIGAGLRIKQNAEYSNSRGSRQNVPVVLPSEPRARNDALNSAIFEKTLEYLNSHTIELKIPTDTIKEMQRSFGDVEEARKKKNKKGGGGGGMMGLLMLKVALLGAIALKVLGLVAFKALLISKIALTLASVIALKKLVEQKHHHSSYEVVAHPHYEDHGHYDRSFSQELAYRGHEPGVVKAD